MVTYYECKHTFTIGSKKSSWRYLINFEGIQLQKYERINNVIKNEKNIRKVIEVLEEELKHYYKDIEVFINPHSKRKTLKVPLAKEFQFRKSIKDPSLIEQGLEYVIEYNFSQHDPKWGGETRKTIIEYNPEYSLEKTSIQQTYNKLN
jgi:hypothetical protein